MLSIPLLLFPPHSVYYHYLWAVFFTILLIFQYLISKSIIKKIPTRFLSLSLILSSFLPPPLILFNFSFSHTAPHAQYIRRLQCWPWIRSWHLTSSQWLLQLLCQPWYGTLFVDSSLVFSTLSCFLFAVFSSLLCLIFCFRTFFSTLFFFFLKLLTLLTFYLLMYHTRHHIFSLF